MFDKWILDHFMWGATCFHHGKSDTQTTAEAVSAQDRKREKQFTDTAQGSLNQFEGPVEQSPFYRALLTQGIESTSQAYDNARASTRAKANQAGFGYTQPIEQGAESELGAREASDLAAVPREALLGTAPLTMSAAGKTADIGTSYGNQGASAMNNATELERQRQQDSLWNKLWALPQAAAQGAGAAAAGCWIAAAVYGGWDDPRVYAVRTKLWKEAGESRFMRMVLGLYIAFGEYVGAAVKRSPYLKAKFRKVLDAYIS